MSQYLWLLPTVQVADLTDRVVVNCGDRCLTINRPSTELLPLLTALDGSRTLDELPVDPDASAVLDALEQERWIVRLQRRLSRVIDGRPWASRQLSYYAQLQRDRPDRALDELAAARVLIVGAGGIGSAVAVNLVGAGVRRIILSDPDIVDATNLNRQFFYTPSDVGTYKVTAAAKFLKARHPDLEVEAWKSDVFTGLRRSGVESLGLTMIIFCGDSDTLRTHPHLAGDVPVLMAGYNGCVGQVGPLAWPARGTACWGCLLDGLDGSAYRSLDEHAVARTTGWNSSGSTINGALGGLAAEAAVRCLAPSLGAPMLLGNRLSVDMATLSIREHALPSVRCRCKHREAVA